MFRNERECQRAPDTHLGEAPSHSQGTAHTSSWRLPSAVSSSACLTRSDAALSSCRSASSGSQFSTHISL